MDCGLLTEFFVVHLIAERWIDLARCTIGHRRYPMIINVEPMDTMLVRAILVTKCSGAGQACLLVSKGTFQGGCYAGVHQDKPALVDPAT